MTRQITLTDTDILQWVKTGKEPHLVKLTREKWEEEDGNFEDLKEILKTFVNLHLLIESYIGDKQNRQVALTQVMDRLDAIRCDYNLPTLPGGPYADVYSINWSSSSCYYDGSAIDSDNYLDEVARLKGEVGNNSLDEVVRKYGPR